MFPGAAATDQRDVASYRSFERLQVKQSVRLLGASGSLIALAVLALLAPAGWAAGRRLVVHTRAGAIEGLFSRGMKEWRGIPYAAVPIGKRRWRAPAPVAPWAGVRSASKFAAPCFQLAPKGVLGSEDCLYLNVFAPRHATSASHLAVMVHLHPGGNASGRPYTDASALTADDVIVVTLAYRLGILGFAGPPALSAQNGGSSGEYGLLDQLAALRWVRANIARFGGDPDRVTLFGSSSGSFDTVALMASPLSRGLISGAAVQGVSFGALTGQGATIHDAQEIGLQVSDRIGCGTSAEVLSCMRAASAKALVQAAGPLDLAPPVGGMVLPKSPIELVAHHRTVPLLIGFDREEDAVFFSPFPNPYGYDDWVTDTDELVGPARGTAARTLYPPSAYQSFLWSYVTMRTDAVRGCPTRRLANAVRAPVWRWLYTHTDARDPRLAQFKASHLLEDQFIWDADQQHLGHALTPNETVLSKRMTAYWTNFAKHHDPNHAGLPHWPRYHPGREPTLTLDNPIGVTHRYHDRQCAFLDTLPSPFPP